MPVGCTLRQEAFGGWFDLGRVRLVTTSFLAAGAAVLLGEPLDEQLHLGASVREGHQVHLEVGVGAHRHEPAPTDETLHL